MSLGSFFKKIGKNKIVRGIGHAIDVGSDFLPPGFRDVGNLGGKLMEGQNIGKSLKGTATDYAMGKVGGMVAGKLGGAAGKSKNVKALTDRFDPSKFTGNIADAANAATASTVAAKMGSPMQNIGSKVVSAIGPRFGDIAKAGATAALSSNGNGAQSIQGDQQSPNGNHGFDLGGILKTPGVAEGLFGLAGGALQGYGQGKIAEADRKWETDKYGMDNAGAVQKQIEMSPLRDRAMYMLSQRMGLPQGSFSPKDIFNPGGTGSQGGYDQNALNTANAGYTPGAGGVDPSVNQRILEKMGYGKPKQQVRR